MKSPAEIILNKPRDQWDWKDRWGVRLLTGAVGFCLVMGIYFAAALLGNWQIRRMAAPVAFYAFIFGLVMTGLAWRATKAPSVPPS